MSDNEVVDKTITNFLLNTCRLYPQLNERRLQAILHCASAPSVHPSDDADLIPLVTGSIAELYIEPMLTCVGDIDVTLHFSTYLAIPAGQSPPTQLPDEFHNYVRVFEIVDSHSPGCVYLELRYLLTECSEGDTYNAVEYDRHQYALNNKPIETCVPDARQFCFSNTDRSTGLHQKLNGPAHVFVTKRTATFDIVRRHSVRCLSWPTQAADWPTRHRSYDWPDSATVGRVVSNGCDVVGVPHRQYGEDEQMRAPKWRLFFSRAEVVLLNSWMPVQQIVYHLLRYLVKTEQLTGGSDHPFTVCNYHIKTLMLWACELKPRCWWTEDIRMVKMCVELLHIFADWLTAEQCQHYFINNCNLIDSSFNVEAIARKLSSVDETWLSTWLINNYIRNCSLLCPGNVSRLLDYMNTNTQLQNAVSRITDWRRNSALQDLWNISGHAGGLVGFTLHRTSVTVRSCHYLLTELARMDAVLPFYFVGVTFLKVYWTISKEKAIEEKLVDVLATLVGHHSSVATRRQCNQCSGEVYLSKAAKLMKDVASKSINTDQLIKIELSKAYLYRALRCTDSYSDSIYCLANVYLAVLYYVTEHYQTGIDHCTLVTRSQYLTEWRSCIVQGELLPAVDDQLDIAFGLSTLYQYVLTASLNQPERKMYVTAFTPQLLAQYLKVICHRVTKSRLLTNVEFAGNTEQHLVIDKRNLFIADVLLFKVIHQPSEYNFYRNALTARRHCTATNPTELNTSTLVELLQKSAVEHLTTYLQLASRDFKSVASFVTTDFEALYEYKRGNYQRCLQLSTQNVQDLLYAVSHCCALTSPVFIQLMDDVIVSLIALTLIVYLERGNSCANISQLTLSLYLMTRCQSNLRQSVTSLSRTLGYIRVVRNRERFAAQWTVDHLALHFAERIAVRNLAKVSAT